jgi:hypothetical protein
MTPAETTCPPGSCPIAAAGLDLPCPCVAHRRYGELMRESPGAWGPRIVRAARMRAGLEPVTPEAGEATGGGGCCGGTGAGPVAPVPPLPSLPRQVAGAAVAVVRHAAGGFRQASPEVVAARLAVCQGCDRLRPDGKCAACGCGVGAKAAWAMERCPLGKWAR